LRQNQKFSSAEGRFIRELQFDKCFEVSGRGLLEVQYLILPGKNEEDHDSTRKDSRVLVRDSNPTTSALKSKVFHPYQLARLDEDMAKFNNSLILSHLEGLKQVSSHTIYDTSFHTSGRAVASKSIIYYHRITRSEY
jgi:hypothetical protein